FAYDGLGRIIASQNAKQLDNSLTLNKGIYSYTRYDKLGRIKEAGEFIADNNLMLIDENGRLIYTSSGDPVPVDAVEDNYPQNLGNTFNQVTKTIYDNPFQSTASYFTN